MEGTSERVIRRYIERTGMEHPSPEARKEYLHEHPNADPGNHTVVEKGDKGGEKKDEGGKKSLKDRLKSLSGKARTFLDKADESVRQFIEDPAYRRKAMTSASEAIAKSPEKVVKGAVKAIKHEAKEWKTAASGIKAALTGGEVTPEHKKAIKHVAIDIAITVSVVALTGGFASGAAGLAKKSAASFIQGFAKRISLEAVTEGMGNIVTLQELGHGAHGALEMVGHFLKAAGESPKEDEVLAAWVTALVVKKLKKLDDEDVMAALEEMGGDTKEASMAERVAARFASRPGPHWNPWPEAPASLKKDLETLHDLAQDKSVDAEARRKLGLIWNMATLAMKDEKKAPQALERAQKAYESLSPTESYLVPRTVINLVHGL
jgi:hypothetical protein